MSAVGVNKDIIQEGENGYLAITDEEWFDKLCLLIEDKALRKRIGKAGRETVVESYSLEVWKDQYVAYFNQLVNK